MRVEKQLLALEYRQRLTASAYFIVVEYKGLNVAQFRELRSRLAKVAAEVHVVKNSLFRCAAKEAGLADLLSVLAGQLAVVTGQRDVSAAAKVLKTFQAEFDKPRIHFGYLGNQHLDRDALLALAELPPLEVLRGHLLGVLQAPASRLVRLLNTPATQLARVLQARIERGT